MADKKLQVDKMNIVVVGDKASNIEKLNELGYEIIELNEKGEVIDSKNKEMKKLSDDNYFLLTGTGKKMERLELSLTYTKLGNVIGRKLSIRTARHIKVTNNINIQKVTDLATEMSHDPTTALSIYAKK